MGTPEDPEHAEGGPLAPAEGSAPTDAVVDTPAAMRPSLAFPLHRSAVDLSRVMSRASEAWSNDIGTWVLTMVLCLLIGVGIPVLFGASLALFLPGDPDSATGALSKGLEIGVQIVQAVVQGVLYMGVLAMALHALHGGPASIGKLFSQVSKIGKYLLQSALLSLPLILLFAVIVGVAYAIAGIDLDSPMDLVVQEMGPTVAIASFIAAPFVIYAFLGVVFGPIELVFNDDAGPVQALKSSWRLAKGKRWLIFGVLFIAWLIAAGSMLLCGIGALFGFPFALLMVTALYLGLRNGAEVPEARTDSTLDRPTASGS